MKASVFMIAAMAASALTAVSASAQTTATTVGTYEVGFSGAVPAGCLLSTPTAPEMNNATAVSLSPGSADIVVTQLVGDDGVPVGAVVILDLPSICNQAHTLRLSSVGGGMVNPEADGAGGAFRGALPYSVQVNWGGSVQTYQTGEPVLSLPIGNATTGQVTLTIQIPAGGAPLVAGVYSDQLVLELGAAG
jgi:hypothetical protein